MITFEPTISTSPENLDYTPKFVLNILIAVQKGKLGSCTVEKLVKYSELDKQVVNEALKILLDKNLITSIEWV